MMTRRVFLPVLVIALSLLGTAVARGEQASNWPQWRGPHFNGSSGAKNLPEKFGPAENLVWSLELPGPGAGTPVVWADRVFVSALDAKSKKLVGLCVGRKDGKVLWRKDIGEGFVSSGRNNMASPSPITDGKHVWFHFATGDLVCFDVDGKEVWKRNLVKDHGSFNFMHIYGSSPLLHKGKLYVQVIHRDKPYGDGVEGPSYLLAVDPMTGKDLWKHVRPDPSVDESKEAYSTPTPHTTAAGREEIILVGGDVVTGHDPETGNELWRLGGWNPTKVGHWRLVPSATTGAGLIFVCAPKGEPVYAIKEDGSGDVSETHVAWKTKEFTSDVCVPLFYQDNLYVLNGDGPKTLTCADPKTGKPKWSVKLGGDPVFRASPTGADGKIYCMNEGGQVWVVSADEAKVLHQVDLGGGGGDGASRASIALVDGAAFVRTADTLYCFGKK